MTVPSTAYENPQPLEVCIREAYEELTSTQPYGNPPRITYAPHLYMLGHKLREAFLLEHGGKEFLRKDVMYFAYKMSAMMDIKDAEKGPVMPEFTLIKALHNLEIQFKKFGEFPPPSPEEIQRILVHIGNYAMIAERKIIK